MRGMIAHRRRPAATCQSRRRPLLSAQTGCANGPLQLWWGRLARADGKSMQPSQQRTIAQAIEDAAKAEPTRGYRFVPETGVPGFSAPGIDAQGGANASEASYSYTAVERISARFGGALQALGLRKGDRVALILPNNDDFVLAFFGSIRAGIVPAPIYPPTT